MRSKLINFKLQPEYKNVLIKLSKEDGETMAVVVRRLIRQEAERRGIWPGKVSQPKEEQP